MKAAYRLLQQSAKLRRLRKENARLFAKNIVILIELETIAEDPTSERSKAIITRYRKRIDIRNEREQATQN